MTAPPAGERPALGALLALCLLCPAAAQSGVATAVEAVGMTVSDLDRSVEFYTRVLAFEVVEQRELQGEAHERLTGVFALRARTARLRLGREHLELTEFLTPRGRPVPVDSRSLDRWFQHVALIVRDMDEAYRWLRRHGVRHASPGPQRLPDWNAAAGGIEAFYFRDPDDHFLEVLRFPPGKGDPRWQERGALFLGIDHTAIVVADTEASLRFYRDTLGMAVAGASENWGPEQERLNSVFGARLRITALRAPAGPGVELLEYLAPPGGRPMPSDTRPTDLWYWHVTVATRDAGAADRALRAARAPMVSPGVVELAADHRALHVLDPDGHALRLTERGAKRADGARHPTARADRRAAAVR